MCVMLGETLLCCVFDGHGSAGRHAARLCVDSFPKLLYSHKRHLFGRQADKAFARACGDMHTELMKCGVDMSLSGSTGTILVATDTHYLVGALRLLDTC